MAEQGHITEAMAKMALANPAQVWRDKSAGSINYAADYVMDALDDTVGAIDEDIVVTTTIDPKMQAEAERALTDELNAKGAKFGVGEGALVAIDPNGAVKAMIGGRSYAESQFNRAVAAKRQPGSSFKPFVYLAALEKGLTPDTVREDAPISVKGWNPENYSREYFGPVTLTKALSLSLNTVAVRLGLEVGPKTVVGGRPPARHRLRARCRTPSIALGTSEVTPLEMVSAYAAFANGGDRRAAACDRKSAHRQRQAALSRRNASFGRVIEPQYVAMMNEMMQETLLTGTARKAELPGWQAAGKTGTSQDWRDAWFVGYTSYLVAAVWLGNDDNSPTKKVSGGNLPVEIWSRFMKEAHDGRPGRRPAARSLAQRRFAQPLPGALAPARPHRRAGADPADRRPGRGRSGGGRRAAQSHEPSSLRPRRACACAGRQQRPAAAGAHSERRRPAGAARQEPVQQDLRDAVSALRDAPMREGIMIDDVEIARALHVIFVAHWIGGVAFVTLVALPLARSSGDAAKGWALFAAIESRFAAQVRWSIPLAGATGLWMTWRLGLWAAFADPSFWWMDAMAVLWALFMAVVFVIEPLAQKRIAAMAAEDPAALLARLSRVHFVLLAAGIVTIFGAVAGAHGGVFG